MIAARRLAAILSADVVGYSRLMGNDREAVRFGHRPKMPHSPIWEAGRLQIRARMGPLLTFRRFALPQEYRGRHAVPGAGALFCKSSDPSLTFRTSKSRAVSKWPNDTASRSLGLMEAMSLPPPQGVKVRALSSLRAVPKEPS
jgi:hypothetical protein